MVAPCGPDQCHATRCVWSCKPGQVSDQVIHRETGTPGEEIIGKQIDLVAKLKLIIVHLL
jgi:hypothetical protein